MKVEQLIEWLKLCNQDAEVEISMAVSDNDRIFGEVCEVLICDKRTATVICDEVCRNF